MGLIEIISSPHIHTGQLNGLIKILDDVDLIRLMRCSSLLYKKEYSQPWLFKNLYYLHKIYNFNKKYKILKIVWNLYDDFDSLKWPNIKHIVCQNIINENHYNIITNLHRFTHVNFNNCSLIFTDFVKNITHIQELSLRSNKLYDKDIKLLFENLNDIKKLTLWNNNFGNKGLEYLSEFLIKNNTLINLDLYNCGFDNIDPIAEAMTINNTLLFLDLGGNFIYDIKKFCNALKINKSLKMISFGACKNIINYDDLADMLMINSTITQLMLYSNDISELSSSFVEALKKNIGIKKLNLSHNSISNVEQIAEILKVNSTITNINLAENSISNILALVEVLKSNTIIRKINLIYNPILIKTTYDSRLKFSQIGTGQES